MPKVSKARKFRSSTAIRKTTTNKPAPGADGDHHDSTKKTSASSSPQVDNRRAVDLMTALDDSVKSKPASSTKDTASQSSKKHDLIANSSGDKPPSREAKQPQPPSKKESMKKEEEGLNSAAGDGKKKLGAKKAAAAAAAASDGQPTLSRGQRKRQAKREQYLRKEKMVLSSLKLKKAEEQAKRIDGLDAIKEALLETVTAPESEPNTSAKKEQQKQQPNLLHSNRGRQKLVAQEAAQMNLVLQHPAYQADPLATLREHLRNSIQTDDSKSKQQQASEKKVRRKRHKSKYRATRSRNR